MPWTKIGNIRGPQGEQGPTGEPGATGARGATGATGPSGTAGAQRANAGGTEYTTTSTSYVTLGGGPSVTVQNTNATASRVFVVWFACSLFQAGSIAPVYTAVEATGDTTYAATDLDAIVHNGNGQAEAYMGMAIISVAPGETVITMKHRVASGTGRFKNRRLVALPL